MLDLTLIPATHATLPPVFEARHLIDGEFIPSRARPGTSTATREVPGQARDGDTSSERLSPSHGTVVSRAPIGTIQDAEAAIAAARRAFDDGRWSQLSGKARAMVLLKVADLIEANTDRMALLETLESGKPITQARGEIRGAADLWRYAASLARTLHGDSHNSLGQDMLAVVLKEPIGVVSIITPWNFPFWILSQKLPFALAAGCTCVVKHSELTPSTTVILGELLIEAGLPAGVVNIVLGYGQPVGATLASHPDVDMVTFTGSTAVGRGIAAAASSTLKKVALELGGKNPQVIFPDADLEAAADAVTFGVYFNVGQCCNSGSRIIVHEDIAEAFTARVVELSKQVAFGDPLDPSTQVGAIVSPEHGAKIDAYVSAARKAGATVALGGAALQVPGLGPQFYQPTIVTGVTPDMAIAREEVFGPVLTVLTFR
ncbi:MAG: aldehyde dehydrogenase family protein, partial [Tabrizicola sp.]